MTRPLLLALLVLSTCSASFCQKIERYYTFNWHDTTASNARFYSLTEKTDSTWHRRDYYLHSLFLQMEGFYEDSACKISSGPFHFWHPNRVPESIGVYRKGKKQGLWLRFYSNGMMSDSTVYNEEGNSTGIRQSWYRNGYSRDSAIHNPDGSGTEVAWFDNGNPAAAGRYGVGGKPFGKWQYFYHNGGTSALETYDRDGKLQDKQYFDEKGTPMTDTTTKNREAEFPGGIKAWSKYLSKALYFPDGYKFNNGDQAAVVIDATVNEEGKIVDAEVAVPFYPAFDKIALEAVQKSPRWIPAFEHNRPIRYTIRQPVVFRIPEED
jgi:TonB family protein